MNNGRYIVNLLTYSHSLHSLHQMESFDVFSCERQLHDESWSYEYILYTENGKKMIRKSSITSLSSNDNLNNLEVSTLDVSVVLLQMSIKMTLIEIKDQ